jgi:hypothetical protein
MRARLIGAIALLTVCAPALADAAQITYYFSGLVSTVECESTCGSPSVTGNATVGSRFFGQYTFSDGWLPSSFSSPGANAVYVSEINSAIYAAQIALRGVDFLFYGLAIETSASAYDVYNNFLGNQLGAGGGTGTGNGQPLTYGYWLLELKGSIDPGFFVPLTPVPLIADLPSTMFVLAAYEQGVVFDGTGGVGRIYRGNIDYLSTAPGAPPSSVPLPATLPLFAFGLGLIGLLARRRVRR